MRLLRGGNPTTLEQAEIEGRLAGKRVEAFPRKRFKPTINVTQTAAEQEDLDFPGDIWIVPCLDGRRHCFDQSYPATRSPQAAYRAIENGMRDLLEAAAFAIIAARILSFHDTRV